MARIYQGGQSEKRYQGNASGANFNPNQVTNNNKAIKEEGAAAIRDLQTQDRESQRDEQMSAVSRRAQDATDKTQLEIVNQQLADKQRLEQTIEKNLLDASQTYRKGELTLDQLTDRGDLAFRNTTQKNKQSFSQQLARDTLKLQDLEEKTALGIESRALAANNALETQQLQASQRVDNANRSVGQSVIQGLIDFGLKGMEVVVEQREDAAKKKQQLADIGFNALINPDAGSTASTVNQQNDILASETAQEQAIQVVAFGSPLLQEAIRQPTADITMARNIEQRDIGMASMTFGGDLMSVIADPNTKVMTSSGMKSFSEITNVSEYQQGVMQIARQLTREYGISNKDAFAAKMSYARAVRGAISAQVSNAAANILTRNEGNRYAAALDNAVALTQNGQAQNGWNVISSAAIARYPGKSRKDAITAGFKDLMAQTPDHLLPSLGDVLKDPQNSGSAFKNDYFYKEMLQDEIFSRRDEVISENNTVSAENAYEVKVIARTTAIALSQAQVGEESEQIRQQAISRLEELGTSEALDEITKLRGPSGNLSRNNNVYLGLQEGFYNNEPPSDEEIDDALARKEITFEQAKGLKAQGQTSNQLNNTLKEAGLDKGLKELNSIVATSIVSNSGGKIDITEARNQSGGIAKQLYDRYERSLKDYIKSQGDSLTMSGLREFADKEKAKLTSELMGPDKNEPNDGDIVVEDGVVTYKGWNKVPPPRQTYNPATGKPQNNYTGYTPAQLPANASPSDRLLSRKQFIDNMKVLEDGRTDFGPRLTELSRKLTTTPVRLLEAQSKALGYSGGSLGEIVKPDLEKFEPTNMESGKNALKAMGFSDIGAAYLAGNIMQESSWKTGKRPHDDGGAPAGGLASWRAGRLDRIQEHLGKGTGKPKLIQDASPAEQLNAMKWEMKTYFPSAYRIFTNPNATKTQLERESYRYWEWGDEGKRFAYAESLITSGTHVPSSGSGERSPTGALTYTSNKAAYVETGEMFDDLRGFKVAEHSAFGGTAPVHAGNSYHNHDEAFDITHWDGTRSHSIAETKRLKEIVRSMNLFEEVIGPGDYEAGLWKDRSHDTHLHLGGLMRQPTAAEKARLKALFN